MAKKILIVDDEPDIMTIVNLRLKKLGYETIIGRNGQEGIDLARKHVPDLILMDFRMPVLDGIEACKIIKADAALKHIPVIFMSASSANVNLDMVKAVDASDFIRKPFETEQLTEKIKTHLA